MSSSVPLPASSLPLPHAARVFPGLLFLLLGCWAGGASLLAAGCGDGGAAGPAEGPPQRCPAEVCNGQDDDCDGATDEELTPPAGLSCLQQGLCAGSAPACRGAAGWGCGYPPGHEAPEASCNGQDDDCDGATDEELAPPPATLSTGVCAGQLLRCAGRDGWQEPDPAALPGFEPEEASCDGLDNDCDGRTDLDSRGNPLTRPCWDGDPALPGQGICHGGTQSCGAGSWGGCAGQQLPRAEECNGLDDDCDGLTDLDDPDLQGVQPPPADRRLGVCAGLSRVCGGADGWVEPDYAAVLGAAYAATEARCDGLDDDCDGLTDLDDPDLQGVQPLAAEQRGVCAGARQVCDPAGGGWREPTAVELFSAAGHRYQEEEDWCDGLDNDCDGEVDEEMDIGGPCFGRPSSPCGEGVRECSCREGMQCRYPGELGGEPATPLQPICSTMVGGSDDRHQPRESCLANALDDDCNGYVDDGGLCRPDCDLAVHLDVPRDLDDCAGAVFGRSTAATQRKLVGGMVKVVGVPADELRAEYLPELTTLPAEVRVGFLVEGRSANLLAQSGRAVAGDQPLPPWAVSDPARLTLAEATDGTSPAPDGKVTQLTWRDPGQAQALYQLLDLAGDQLAGRTFSGSFWVKPPDAAYLGVLYGSLQQGNAGRTRFDFLSIPAPWERVAVGAPPSWNEGALGLRLEATASNRSAFFWGFQLEELPFPTSYIESGAIAGERNADNLLLPADLLSRSAGSYTVWVRPEFLPGEVDAGRRHTIFAAGQYLTFSWEVAGGHAQPTCRSGDLFARAEITADDFTRGQWIFLACSWQAGEEPGTSTVHVFYWDGAATEAMAAGEMSQSPAGELAPAPNWSISRDIRLYRTARSHDELEAIVAQTRAQYRYRD